jgi:hypothetical protein
MLFVGGYFGQGMCRMDESTDKDRALATMGGAVMGALLGGTIGPLIGGQFPGPTP